MIPIVFQIRSFTDILLSKIKEIGATCPRLCETRWISIFSIIDFVKTHPSSHRFIVLPELYEDFCSIVIIFQALIEIFEDPKTPLASVFPIIKSALNALHELEIKGNSIAGQFIDPLSNYTISSKTAGVWALSYLFTPKGRKEAQNRLNSPQEPIEYEGFVKQFYVKSHQDKDAIEEGIEELTSNPMNEVLDDENPIAFGQHPEVDITPYLAPPNDPEEQPPQEPSIEEEAAELNSNKDALTLLAYAYLREGVQKVGCPEARVDKDEKTFKEFVLFNKSELTIVTNQVGHQRYDFANARINAPKWRFIADVALRLEACTASEASCERTISSQRLLLTCHNLRSDKRLLEARLTFMKGFEK
jgi:hypothetical protein